ncbi:MAG: glycosyltransferase [Acidobacteriota bacterium]
MHVFYPHAVYPSFLRPPSRIYARIDREFIVPGIETSYCDYPALPLLSRPLNGRIAGRILLPQIRRFAPDLIFSYVLYPDAYAALKIAKKLSVPVIAMGVGSDVHNIADRFSAMHTRSVLREADFVVAISEDLRKRAVAMGASPEKTRTLISGCDLSVFHVSDRREAREMLHIESDIEAVVYIGRIDTKKGLRELVEASASLHPERPDLHVYMVGDGPDRQVLENAIQSRSAADYIHLVRGCSFDEVARWMSAANVITLPSYMEGCPNVVLEALACGRPVVATNVGGIPEIVNEQCGCLVSPRDSESLAHGLEFALDKDWDENAIATCWGRSWEIVADELLEIFESVLSSRMGAQR